MLSAIRQHRAVRLATGMLLAAPQWATAGPGIGPDEEITFFATAAYPVEDGWMVPIRGCVFEPEHSSLRRQMLMGVLLDALDLDEEPVKSQRFRERVRGFLVDNERGERFKIELGGDRFEVGPSAADGYFETHLHFPAGELRRLVGDRPYDGSPQLTFKAVLNGPAVRKFTGAVHFPRPTGVSIISDIDDTIKVTGLTDARQALAKTLLEEFEAVPGMAEIYQGWAEQGMMFHYVSATPWHLYLPVSSFLKSAGFPEGTFELSRLRLRARALAHMYEHAGEVKVAAVESLLDRYPGRKFVLIGDSGQDDPEMYADVARRRPAQVLHILIRDVTGAGAGSDRFVAAFAGLPQGLARVFGSASELAALDIGLPASRD